MSLTIPSVFMLREPLPIAQQMLTLLAPPTPEPSWRTTRADDFAAAEMAAARLILQQAMSIASADTADFGSYLDQVDVHLERAKGWGYPSLVTLPISHSIQSELDAVAPTLSLLTIYAEVCLAATAWAVHDHTLALQLLASGHTKALAIARVRPVRIAHVEEELDLQLSAQLGYRRVMQFKGYRPEPGSAAYLAQDIDLAQIIAGGHRLSVEEIARVYSDGNRIVDETPRTM